MKGLIWITALPVVLFSGCDEGNDDAGGGGLEPPSEPEVVDPFENFEEEDLAEGEAPSMPDLELAEAYYKETGEFPDIEVVDAEGIAAEISAQALADLDLSVYGHMINGPHFKVMIEDLETASEAERREACEAISEFVLGAVESLEIKGPIALVLTDAGFMDRRQPHAYNRTLMPPDAAGDCVVL